jgi:hypothetical protein
MGAIARAIGGVFNGVRHEVGRPLRDLLRATFG